MSYKIEYKKTPEKILSKLTGKIYNSITTAIEDLAENPRPAGYVEVKPYSNVYRIRKGDYRIIYEVQDEVLLILVLDIGVRGQIYDKW